MALYARGSDYISLTSDLDLTVKL